MTRRTFMADIDRWVRLSERRLDAVTKQATNNLLRGIRIAPGINRSGTRQRGTIPRDLGVLAASLQSTLYGSTAISQAGQDSYALVVGFMGAGDRAVFSWGGAAAPYVKEVHYGANGVPGTFWIDDRAADWPAIVRAATAEAKLRVRP